MRLITFLCELRISGQRNSRELTNETPLKNENICNGYHCGIMAFLKFFTLRLRAGPRFLLGHYWEMTSTLCQVLLVCVFLFCFVFCFSFLVLLVFFVFVFVFFCRVILERLRSSQGRGAQLLYPSPRSAPAAMKIRIDQLNKKWRKRIIENSLAGPVLPLKGGALCDILKDGCKGD